MHNRFTPCNEQAESIHYASRCTLRKPRFRYLYFLRLDAVNRLAIHATLSFFGSFESVHFDIVLVYLKGNRANHHGPMD